MLIARSGVSINWSSMFTLQRRNNVMSITGCNHWTSIDTFQNYKTDFSGYVALQYFSHQQAYGIGNEIQDVLILCSEV